MFLLSPLSGFGFTYNGVFSKFLVSKAVSSTLARAATPIWFKSAPMSTTEAVPRNLIPIYQTLQADCPTCMDTALVGNVVNP